MPRKGKTEPGWDEIGKMVGKKMEKGFNDKECCKPWKMWGYHRKMNGGGFFGRALFVIGVLIALNALGLLHGVATWVQVLIGIGFALMSF